jgi:hypothetical protein
MSNIRATKVTLHINGQSIPVKSLSVSFAESAEAAQRSFARLNDVLWQRLLSETFGPTDPTLESLL